YPYMFSVVPSEIHLERLLTVRLERLDGSKPLETFLNDLWHLAEMDVSGPRLLGQGRWNTDLYNYKENYDTLRDSLSGEELELLTKWGFDVYLEGEMTGEKVRAILSAPNFASLCILMLTEKGLLLPPRNLGGDPISSIRKLGWMKPFERWFPRAENQIKLASMLLSSTIREHRDIPADLRNKWGSFSHNQKPHLKYFRKMLLEFSEENDLPTFDIAPFESFISTRVDGEMRMWRPQWFRDQGYPEVWCNFADAAFESDRASIQTTADR